MTKQTTTKTRTDAASSGLPCFDNMSDAVQHALQDALEILSDKPEAVAAMDIILGILDAEQDNAKLVSDVTAKLDAIRKRSPFKIGAAIV